MGELNATRLRVYRDAFGQWRERQPTLPPYETFFAEPFYQLMRLTLLAQAMEQARQTGAGEMGADVVSVLHVSPDANLQLSESFTSRDLLRYGRTVTSAWANLAPPDRFKSVASESLLTAIEQASPAHARPWAQWLLARYGWWRQDARHTPPPA